MQAVILAGGLGTRLKSVISAVPKPMALIHKKPFLCYLLDWLIRYGIKKTVLSVGYKYEVIRDYFGDNYRELQIFYSIENEPLGTGGALKKASKFILNENFFALNGDSFFDIDLDDFHQFHLSKQAEFSIALKHKLNINRYGSVKISTDGRIIGFTEKKFQKSGYINGGIYIINKAFLEGIDEGIKFSLEKDIMEKYYISNLFFGKIYGSKFIDIGTPKNYSKAKRFFEK